MKSHEVLALLAVIVLPAGCASPREVSWHDDAGMIGPSRDGTRGYLSVEQIDPLVVRSRVPRMRSAPFLLYDDHGRYLTKFNDPYLPPVSIPAGRYVVVARVEREERRIQVVVQPARLTRVDLGRLDVQPERAAPEIPAETLPDVH